MVVCRYFQQGNCRFGQNCRFDHIYGSKYSYNSQATQQQTVPSGVTDEQLVNQVQSDVQAVLKGNQWLLSSYAPFKEKPNFPGISDLSMEEARLFIYEARKNNNVDQAVSHMVRLFNESRQKYEQLLHPNSAIINIFRSIYNGEIAAAPFGESNNPGFGGNPSATSIFRGAVQNTSVFGQTNNNATTNSIFGQSLPTSGSVFGQNSGFGQTANAPPFNQTFESNTDSAAKSIFAQATQNAFNQNQVASNIFGNTQAPSNQDATAKSVFAQASPFGSNQPQTNQDNVFNTQSVFASSPFSNPQSGSPFSNNAQSTPFGVPGASSQQNVNNNDTISVYSDMKDLSSSDVEAFNLPDFKLGFVPETAPAQSFCF